MGYFIKSITHALKKPQHILFKTIRVSWRKTITKELGTFDTKENAEKAMVKDADDTVQYSYYNNDGSPDIEW